jgi:hypothetical protein
MILYRCVLLIGHRHDNETDKMFILGRLSRVRIARRSSPIEPRLPFRRDDIANRLGQLFVSIVGDAQHGHGAAVFVWPGTITIP